MGKARRQQRGRKPFSWDSVDTSELESAATVDDLRRASRRFDKSVDAAHGAGAGELVRPGAFNVAGWFAEQFGVEDPQRKGQWQRGVGVVGADGAKL